MAQVATTIRMDSELKRKFDQLCEEFGMSVNTAFNIFVKAVVRNRSIPFRIESCELDAQDRLELAISKLREKAYERPELTLDEVNEEIAAYRATKRR